MLAMSVIDVASWAFLSSLLFSASGNSILAREDIDYIRLFAAPLGSRRERKANKKKKKQKMEKKKKKKKKKKFRRC